MDGAEIILAAGAVGLAILYMTKLRNNAAFSDFMNSSGASEEDISSSIVPVNGTDASQGAIVTAVKSVSDWAQAIFHFEGGNPGNLNVRNNNPGNLKAAPDQFTGANTVRDENGFVIFPSMESGFAALQAQLNKTLNESPSLTLTQFFAKYLGQKDYLNPQVTNQGNPFTYAKSVADKLGVSPDQPIGTIFGG